MEVWEFINRHRRTATAQHWPTPRTRESRPELGRVVGLHRWSRVHSSKSCPQCRRENQEINGGRRLHVVVMHGLVFLVLLIFFLDDIAHTHRQIILELEVEALPCGARIVVTGRTRDPTFGQYT